jgi:hypothetical protein
MIKCCEQKSTVTWSINQQISDEPPNQSKCTCSINIILHIYYGRLTFLEFIYVSLMSEISLLQIMQLSLQVQKQRTIRRCCLIQSTTS